MNSGNHNNQHYDYNNSYPNYTYGQYPDYYYHQQYYAANMPYAVPQGDPSAALSMTYQYQQTQAPAQQYTYPPEYYADYYANQDQRSMIHYGDLSHEAQYKTHGKPPGPNHSARHQELISPLEKPKFCCYRILKTAMAVIQHEKLHVKCLSCDFMCLPSLLQEHEETFHAKPPKEPKKPSRPDGVIPFNAPKISTPEELDAWIAARKKNWPSKDNVERKEKEMAEKIARGEIVPKHKRKVNDEQQEMKKKQKTTGDLVNDTHEPTSDSDDIMDPEKDAITSKDPSTMGKILLPEDPPKRRCKYFMMGRCRNGDECAFSHEKPEPKPKQPRTVNPIRKRPNLLYKLLEKEIHQEKNVILQCLRYIVDNNFFEANDLLSKKDDIVKSSAIAEEVTDSNDTNAIIM